MTKIIRINGKECKGLLYKKTDNNGLHIFKVEYVFRNGTHIEKVSIGAYKSFQAVRLYTLIGEIAKIMTPQGLRASIKDDLKPLHEGERLETTEFFRMLNDMQANTIERLARALKIKYIAPEIEIYDDNEATESKNIAFYKSKLHNTERELAELREALRPLLKCVLEQNRAHQA